VFETTTNFLTCMRVAATAKPKRYLRRLAAMEETTGQTQIHFAGDLSCNL
jgi:hypothetical protein